MSFEQYNKPNYRGGNSRYVDPFAKSQEEIDANVRAIVPKFEFSKYLQMLASGEKVRTPTVIALQSCGVQGRQNTRLTKYVNEQWPFLKFLGKAAETLLLFSLDSKTRDETIEFIQTNIFNHPFLLRHVSRLYLVDTLVDSLEVIQDKNAWKNILDSDLSFRLHVDPVKMQEPIAKSIDENVKLSPTEYTHLFTIIPMENFCLIGFEEASFDYVHMWKNQPDYGAICKAYYKIRECHLRNLFELNPETTTAVDVGAAPGGWTQYLGPYCKKLFAIDPAIMKYEAENVVHLKMKVQDSLEILGDQVIDLVVDDVITSHPKDSLHIVEPIVRHLKVGGYLVLTLKLGGRNDNYVNSLLDWFRHHVNAIMPYMHIEQIVHLFANTNFERTVIAKKMSPYEGPYVELETYNWFIENHEHNKKKEKTTEDK